MIQCSYTIDLSCMCQGISEACSGMEILFGHISHWHGFVVVVSFKNSFAKTDLQTGT